MRIFKFLILIFLVLVLLLGSFSTVTAQQNASAAISAAQDNLFHCFSGTVMAEKAGANISTLITELNTAGLFLSDAKNAYSIGNFSGAIILSLDCQNSLNGFDSQVNNLQISAAKNLDNNFLNDLVSFIIGVSVVIVGSFVVWIFLKKKYLNTKEAVL